MPDPRSPDTVVVAGELIRTVGLARAGVAQPTILGEDPALPSVFRVGTAAAGCVGATLAAAVGSISAAAVEERVVAAGAVPP